MANNNGAMSDENLELIPDGRLIEALAAKLRRTFRKERGVEFLYGYFKFIFHDGVLQDVEAHPRFKQYRARAKLGQSTV